MPFNIGGPEGLLILVIVLIVFGAGRLPEVFGQLGKGVRSFREESTNTAPASAPASAAPATAATCAKCRASLPPASKFCPSCGAAV